MDFFSPAAFGLCESASDWDEPLTCSLATNTCGSCSADTECDRGFDLVYSIYPFCDPATLTCVERLTTTDCAPPFTSRSLTRL